GLEAKFSMPFCLAAALARGQVSIDSFDEASLTSPDLAALLPRVTMRVNPSFDGAAPPLTEATVTIRLRDGRTLTHTARGARGYPDRPASDDELNQKYLSCATRTLSNGAAARALELARGMDRLDDVRELARVCATGTTGTTGTSGTSGT